MFYKFIELSRSFIRCSSTGHRFQDKRNLLKEMIASALRAHNTSQPNVKHLILSCKKDEIHKVLPLFKNGSLLVLLTNQLKNVKLILKENTIKVTKSCVSQFEFVVAHRVRRAQQIFSLYSKLWDDKALLVMISKLRRQFMQRGRAFMLGLSAAAVINWDEEMIRDQEMLRHSRELEMCHKLKERCSTKVKQDKTTQDCAACDNNEEVGCWEPFVTSGELTCWKREAPNRKGSGLYCYKMYGAYSDVSADDFLEAFLDIKGRKNWDSHVVDLHIISSDPTSNSDLIYWETKWPSLFNNRDYIFKRRFKVLKEKKLIVVCNRSSSHPNYPVYSSKTRVTEYWSYLVIKPFTTFNKPGVEFSLTYFDDPGTSLPSVISSWASTTGMPEFMKKLHLAAVRIADTKALERVETAAPYLENESSEDVPQEEGEHEEPCEPKYKTFPFLYPPSDEDSVIFQMLIS